MAIYTDFFVATEAELAAAFPHRFPVAKKPKRRRIKNPFTGEPQVVEEWGPERPFPELPAGITYPNKDEAKAVKRLHLVQYKGVDQVKLSTLQQLIRGGEFLRYIRDLERPALVAPEDGSSMLLRIPPDWAEVLAAVEDVPALAGRWTGTEELRLDGWGVEDAEEVIAALQRLARQAVAESKSLYLWINL